MNFANIINDNFPTVVFKIKPVEPSLEDYRIFLNETLEILKNHENMVFVMDLSEGRILSSQVRIEQGNWLKTHEELIKKKLHGMVFVHNSIITNMMMKGIFLIKSPPVPYVIVKNIDDAMAWSREKYEMVNVA